MKIARPRPAFTRTKNIAKCTTSSRTNILKILKEAKSFQRKRFFKNRWNILKHTHGHKVKRRKDFKSVIVKRFAESGFLLTGCYFSDPSVSREFESRPFSRIHSSQRKVHTLK